MLTSVNYYNLKFNPSSPWNDCICWIGQRAEKIYHFSWTQFVHFSLFPWCTILRFFFWFWCIMGRCKKHRSKGCLFFDGSSWWMTKIANLQTLQSGLFEQVRPLVRSWRGTIAMEDRNGSFGVPAVFFHLFYAYKILSSSYYI